VLLGVGERRLRPAEATEQGTRSDDLDAAVDAEAAAISQPALYTRSCLGLAPSDVKNVGPISVEKPRRRSVRAQMRLAPAVQRVGLAMYARAVDDATTRLRELRHEKWADLGLSGLTLGLAIVTTQFRPALALPLFLGGLAVGARGMRALRRRWALVERLAGERDAYVIAEVSDYASRAATIERRQSLAALIRSRLVDQGLGVDPRLSAAADELEGLAGELEDGELELDLACAVACVRLFDDVVGSPLLNPQWPPDELRSRVHQIRSGFTARRRAA
jgi:hypothetical protein